MNIFILPERATQAKLVLHKNFAVIKIPNHLPTELQKEIRTKFLNLIEKNRAVYNWNVDDNFSLKVYYKVGAPYVFLNRRLSNRKRETVETYIYNDL